MHNIHQHLAAVARKKSSGLLLDRFSSLRSYSLRLLTDSLLSEPVVRYRENSTSQEASFHYDSVDQYGRGSLINDSDETRSEWLTNYPGATAATIVWLTDQQSNNDANRATQTTTTLQPDSINGPETNTHVGDYGGSGDRLLIPDLGVTSTDMVFALKSDASSDRRIISHASGATTQGGSLRFHASGIEVWPGHTAWGSLISNTDLDTTNFFTVGIKDSGSNLVGYLDGVQKLTAASAQDFNGVNLELGGLYTGAFGSYWDGRFGDVLFFPSTSAEDWAAILADVVACYGTGA